MGVVGGDRVDRGQPRVTGHVLPCPVLKQQIWSDHMTQIGFRLFLTCRLGLGCEWVGSVGEEKVGGGGSGS